MLQYLSFWVSIGGALGGVGTDKLCKRECGGGGIDIGGGTGIRCDKEGYPVRIGPVGINWICGVYINCCCGGDGCCSGG